MSLITDKDELSRIISSGESSRVEFKLRTPSVFKLARTICAFANTKGGTMIIGVADDREITGVDSITEVKTEITQALDTIAPTPEIKTHTKTLKNKPIVLIEVLKGKNKPYTVTNGRGEQISFIRTGPSTVPVPHNQLKLIADEDEYRKKISISPIQKNLIKDLSTPQPIFLADIAKKHNLSIKKTRTLLVPLVKAGIIFETKGRYISR